MLCGTESGLEETGTQHFYAAFTHLGVTFPLAALAQAWIIAHKSLKAGRHFAIASGVQNFPWQPGQDLGHVNGTKTGKAFYQGLNLLIGASGSKFGDLLVQAA